MMRRKAAALALLAVLGLAAVTSAHSPIFLRDGTAGVREHPAIRDPEQSWAIYGRLPAGPAADVIPIQAEQGQKLYLQVLTPDRPDLASFRPQAVLLGPGLKGTAPSDSPVATPGNQGALTVENPAEPRRIYEGFTQMNLLEYGTATGTFPESGRYLAVVYDPAQRGGPYVLAVGQKEKFGALDVLKFPLVWARAHVWLWK